MVNNYPEYAAGVNYKKTDSNGVRHFYSAQVVADPSDDTIESKLIKDGVVISEGGGGGSSDFSTAEVTFNLDDGSVVNFNVANYQIQGDMGMALGENSVFANTPNIINVILCKGSSMLTFTRIAPEGSDVSISGNIEDAGNNSYIITGDCAITLTNPT